MRALARTRKGKVPSKISPAVGFFFIKFIYSKKATKFCKISTILLSCAVPVKSKVEISQNFVAFSEYMNFMETESELFWRGQYLEYWFGLYIFVISDLHKFFIKIHTFIMKKVISLIRTLWSLIIIDNLMDQYYIIKAFVQSCRWILS